MSGGRIWRVPFLRCIFLSGKDDCQGRGIAYAWIAEQRLLTTIIGTMLNRLRSIRCAEVATCGAVLQNFREAG